MYEQPLPGIILAAGASSRFAPKHKLLQVFRGKPLVWHGVLAALEAGLSPVLVVLGYCNQELVKGLDTLCHHPKLHVVYNADWESGRASSLKVGMKHLPPQTPGFLAAPADLPLLSTELIRCVAQTFLETRQLCFPVYNQQKGHPVAFPKCWFEALLGLEGQQSAHALIAEHWDAAIKLPRSDMVTQFNVNTPEDYRRLSEF